MKRLVERLAHNHLLDFQDYCRLIEDCDEVTLAYLRELAVEVTQQRFGRGVYVRGLLEVSSYCHNNCRYCGLRCENKEAERYRLSDDVILNCCESAYKLGLRTFVLQGGEDAAFTDERLVSLIKEIKNRYPHVAITLSLGERSEDSYQKLFEAGASRYLLRHETANRDLYQSLHSENMSFENRVQCIDSLHKIGYQVGMGMMIGVPGQTSAHLVEDLMLMKRINPRMIGLGPFIPHRSTPFASNKAGDLRQTLIMIAIVRLMFPDALIPATTALSSLNKDGRSQGILSGANVVMPNISPVEVRAKYSIYNDKLSTGAESAEKLNLLEQELNSIGYHIDYSRGDYKRYQDD